MESKNKLLKDLGFSDNFLKVIENHQHDLVIEDSDNLYHCFDSLPPQEMDLTSLIIEKTEIPLNLSTFCSAE